ncbi:MAG: serine/threonine protein kinase [Victivallales bacterium]|jgi:Ser/Thr protein kinase RdoA (MazF antagonist)|nr:serine/threonine protein kinase [Victivallales bacterium]
MPEFGTFDTLTPDVIFAAAEAAFACRFSGVLMPLPSYINRVYELEAADLSERFIFKFYRPGRWSRAALLEEHLFTLEAHESEIPVIAPLRQENNSTLGVTSDGTFFAAFPKRWGRGLEPESEAPIWRRLGALLGRLHTVGSEHSAKYRIVLDPKGNTLNEIAHLLSSDVASNRVRPSLYSVLTRLLKVLQEQYRPSEVIRLHGDCHKGNILERPGEGLMLIDFDDMLSGPPVQDLWLLLPGPVSECSFELTELLAGYESIRKFDRRSLDQIELLRAMRMIYFLDWCAKQRNDGNFLERYPDWGSDGFWRAEIIALEAQYDAIVTGGSY